MSKPLNFLLLGLAAALSLGTPAQAAGTIEVKYLAPENYTDIGFGTYERERTLKSLSDYVQTLAKQLPDGQTLRLEVLDIDLAGEWRHWGAQEVRVLRGRADWPHMILRYTLSAAPKGATASTLKAGDANLSDMSYLYTLNIGTQRYGDLAYEKRMLNQWFEQNFVAH